jgi:GPH family glycoside/pentoside/hexuronide:cation symporter
MISIAVSIVGFALKWVCYRPDIPWLAVVPAPLISFGLGGLFTLVPSMIADVVDIDELETHERREGMYGSIFWWMVKLGLSAALVTSGYVLNATGFDVELGPDQTARTLTLMRVADIGIPVLTSAIALWALARFPITEEVANAVRRKLEERRGKV